MTGGIASIGAASDLSGAAVTLGTIAGTLSDGTASWNTSTQALAGFATIAATTSVTAPLYDASGASGITFGSADVTSFTFSGQSEDLVVTPSSDTWTLSSSTGVTLVDFGAIGVGVGSLDVSDGNIANVGDIALDSISADGTNVLFGSGAATQLQFRDTAIHIASLDDGHLDLTADTSIDLNGAVSITGAVTPSGGILALTPVVDDPDNDAFTGANLYGGTFIANAAGDFDHSGAAVAAGENWSYESQVAGVVTLSINASDTIYYNGTALTQGHGLTSDGTVAASVVCQYQAANTYDCRGVSFSETP